MMYLLLETIELKIYSTKYLKFKLQYFYLYYLDFRGETTSRWSYVQDKPTFWRPCMQLYILKAPSINCRELACTAGYIGVVAERREGRALLEGSGLLSPRVLGSIGTLSLLSL